MTQNLNTKAIGIPCNENNFYRLWLTFLSPLHKLTSKSVQVAAELLKHRKRLSKVTTDLNILNKILLGSETKQDIMKECGITSSNYYVVISKLKKAGFLTNYGINPKFIPDNNIDAKNYHLHIMFNIS